MYEKGIKENGNSPMETTKLFTDCSFGAHFLGWDKNNTLWAPLSGSKIFKKLLVPMIYKQLLKNLVADL